MSKKTKLQEELKKTLEKTYKQNEKFNISIFKKYLKDYNSLKSFYEECLKKGIKFNEFCYLINFTVEPCYCGKPRKWYKNHYGTCGSKVCKTKARSETCLKKYNVLNASSSDSVKNKIKQTKSQFSEEKLSEIKEKRKTTNKEKYGVEYSFQSELVKGKIKDTLIQKYGNDYNKIFGKHNLEHINFKNFNKDYIEQHFIKDGIISISKCCSYFNCGESYFYKFLRDNDIYYKRKQKTQQEIYDFIKDNYSGEIQNSRKIISPYELDIYLPDLKFAIEFNGILWHSYGFNYPCNINHYSEIDKKYHLRKTELAEAKDIHLFHINENEWIEKREIWESKILLKLGKAKHKYNARQTIIKEIPNKIAMEFLDKNHLQGACNAKFNFGMYKDDLLVSVLTISKSRFKKGEYEIIRFASLLNSIVRGGFSKFLKFLKDPKYPSKIVSFGNRRWTYKNNVYSRDLKLVSITNPNFFYYKDKIIYSRFNFQKHKLKDIEGFNFDSSKTALENMLDNGYRVIYDSGNYKYEINLKE
jgi:hypothetical protein